MSYVCSIVGCMSSQHSGSFDPAENLVFQGFDVAEFASEIPVPDALDLVVEVGAMMAIHSAQLFERWTRRCGTVISCRG